MLAFFSMSLLYFFYYFCKYNIGAATDDIQSIFHISSKAFGWVATVHLLVYAGGQFLNGFLGDRYGPKLIMLIGGIGAVIANLCFGFSGALVLFIVFWAINGYFLSCGWAPGSRIMFNWFPEERWGGWMGIYNAMCFAGGGVVSIIAGLAVARFGWRGAFYVPSAFLLGMTILFLFLGKNRPQDVGLKPEWECHNPGSPAKRVGAREYWIAFKNPKMLLCYLAGFGANFIRWGIITWMIKILKVDIAKGGFGLPIAVAAFIKGLSDFGAAFFSLALGSISDRVFKGSRWQTITIGFILGALPLFYIAQGPTILNNGASIYLPGGITMGLFLLGAAMFLSGGLIQGIQTPLFNLPGDILGKELGGTGVGILDGWMYVGASFAGFFLGWWLDTYGLMAGVSLMAIVSVASGVAAILIRK
jgi:OPA family glycerol-3-phosphate transporter-like MFS transporter